MQDTFDIAELIPTPGPVDRAQAMTRFAEKIVQKKVHRHGFKIKSQTEDKLEVTSVPINLTLKFEATPSALKITGIGTYTKKWTLYLIVALNYLVFVSLGAMFFNFIGALIGLVIASVYTPVAMKHGARLVDAGKKAVRETCDALRVELA